MEMNQGEKPICIKTFQPPGQVQRIQPAVPGSTPVPIDPLLANLRMQMPERLRLPLPPSLKQFLLKSILANRPELVPAGCIGEICKIKHH